jgi:Peptidase family M1 domain
MAAPSFFFFFFSLFSFCVPFPPTFSRSFALAFPFFVPSFQWWNNLWLNEAFATYIASMAVDQLFPEWNEWLSFVSGTVVSGMELDQLDSSHPVQVEVRSATEVME